MQEACLAFDNLCVLGQSELDLRLVLESATWLRVYHAIHISSELFSLSGLRDAAVAFDVHSRYRQYQGLTLDEALEFGQHLEASDPRDKVYGLLGLLSEDLREVETLRPDYRKSWQDVYADAMREALRNTNGQMFQLVSHRDEGGIQGDGLPSWVPRLQRKWDVSVDPVSLRCLGRPPKGSICIDGLRQVLLVEGWTICSVHFVSDVAALQNFTYEDPVRRFDHVAAMSHSGAQEHNDMLARTLMADCNWQYHRSTAEERLEYLTLVEHHANGRYVPDMSELRCVHYPLQGIHLALSERSRFGTEGKHSRSCVSNCFGVTLFARNFC